MTGCTDGTARLWRATPLKGRNEEALMQLKESLDEESFRRYELNANHIIANMEGHLAAISKVYFSNQGDRILTGSYKDGSVRIWAFSGDYSKSQHIVINLSEEGGLESSLSPKKTWRKFGRQRKGAPLTKTNLLNASWTCDDLNIVTLQTVPTTPSNASDNPELVTKKVLATKLKIWNSKTGQLLQMFGVSQKEASILVPHPFMPSVVVTAGDDGLVNMWDVDLKASYFTFEIRASASAEPVSEGRIKEGDPVKVCDANFSPDGTRLTVSDHLGRIFLYGVDSPDRYKHVRPEQYFASDYSDIMHDEEGWAIDTNSQLPVHEAPRGPLAMYSGRVYDDQNVSTAHPQPLSIQQLEREITVLQSSKSAAQLTKLMTQSHLAMQRLKKRDATIVAQRRDMSKVY